MTSLTFYGGAGEISGNKILLEDKGAKIYLDFGEEFNFGEEYFWEYLQPRQANRLEVRTHWSTEMAAFGACTPKCQF